MQNHLGYTFCTPKGLGTHQEFATIYKNSLSLSAKQQNVLQKISSCRRASVWWMGRWLGNDS